MREGWLWSDRSPEPARIGLLVAAMLSVVLMLVCAPALWLEGGRRSINGLAEKKNPLEE
jgi:hypothetical protein